MTGLPESNYPAFNAQAAKLRAQGYHVENPAENPAPPCGSWLAYMRMAIAQLVTCDAIYLLPGWMASRGARIEHGLAVGLGLVLLGDRGEDWQPHDVLVRASNLLIESADEPRQCHTLDGDWQDETEARDARDELVIIAHTLAAMAKGV